MKTLHPIRLWLGVPLVALWWAMAAHAQGGWPQADGARIFFQAGPPDARQAQEDDHLERWMERRSNLTLPQLLQALQNEPGFRQYPPWEQQRMRNELIKLYNMRPQQRNRVLNGNEALERMTPEQRQQFDAAMHQYSALPPDRQRLVGLAFAALRRVPPPERQRAMATYPMIGQFSPYERDTLWKLMLWEPYFTDKGPAAGP